MNLEKYLKKQIERHPSVQPQDIVKLCYQAAYGAEHLLQDKERARAYFEQEYAETKARDIPLYEDISGEVCRVNLAAWKARELPPEWLFAMFVAASGIRENGGDRLSAYLKTAGEVLKESSVDFSFGQWQAYLEEYTAAGRPAVHHSPQYRECEQPAYRIVCSRYIRLLPILEKAAQVIREDKVCVIAIDGRAASGKSTMAGQLGEILGAGIVQMDDFFLPPARRTEERLTKPGGNIHYERFLEEVLPRLSLPQSFSYRRFDCGRMDYGGERTVAEGRIRIVEGSYSCHPQFGDYADITVFSDVDSREQMRRILARNGETMAEMFRNRWIPMEEAYFEQYSVWQRSVCV